MTNNGSNWLYCQINGIANYACGTAGTEEDVDALRNLSLRLQQASARIEREIERRLDAGQTAGVSRWS
jgi:hypothetical protein